MTFTDEGLVLGTGTILAERSGRDSSAALMLDGVEERLLALLAIAYGRAVSPKVIGNVRRAAGEWFGGNPCLAYIHLAHTGLPTLDDGEAAFRLFAADRLIEAGAGPRRLLELCEIDAAPLDLRKAGFNPDEPRVPAGNGREGGEWTDDGVPAVTPAAAHQGGQNNPPADKEPFFDSLYGPVHALAQRLGIDESWLLGLAAHEGGWLEQPHNREINNPFGATHAGGRDVQYDSMEDAVAAWGRRYGPVVQGAASAADFIRQLFAAGYNKKDPNWSKGVLEGINSVQRRLDSWKSRHGL